MKAIAQVDLDVGVGRIRFFPQDGGLTIIGFGAGVSPSWVSLDINVDLT